MGLGLEIDTCRDCVKIDNNLPYCCANCYRASECKQNDDKGKQLFNFIQVQRCHSCDKEMIKVERLGVRDMSTGEYGWIEWYFCVNKDCKLDMDSSRFRRLIK